MNHSPEIGKFPEPRLTVNSSDPAVKDCADRLLDLNADAVEKTLLPGAR